MQVTALKTCNKDILKYITAGSFKLGQLIEDDQEITRINLRKFCVIFILFYKSHALKERVALPIRVLSQKIVDILNSKKKKV